MLTFFLRFYLNTAQVSWGSRLPVLLLSLISMHLQKSLYP